MSNNKFIQLHDYYSNPFTASSTLSQESVKLLISYLHEYIEQLLLFGQDWNIIVKAVMIDKQCLIALIYFADYCLARQEPNKAQSLLNHAQALVNDSANTGVFTDRELLTLKAYNSMMAGEFLQSGALFEQIINQYPTDLFAVKKAQGMCFATGNLPRMLLVTENEKVFKANQNRPYFHSLRAFSLEENKKYSEALEAGKLSIQQCNYDSWGIHGQIHAFHGLGQIQEAIDYLEKNIHHSKKCMNFMYTHSYFHLALLYLDVDNLQKVREIFDQHIWLNEDNKDNKDNDKTNAGNDENGDNTQHNKVGSKLSNNSTVENTFNLDTLSYSDYPSFTIHNKFSPDEQENAMNCIWKLEIRTTGFGSYNVSMGTNLEAKQHQNLTDESLTSRYIDICKYLSIPDSKEECKPVGLYGLFVLRCLLRANYLKEAEIYLNFIRKSAADTNFRNYARVYLPLAEAIYYQLTDKINGGKQAYLLVKPIFTAPDSNIIDNSDPNAAIIDAETNELNNLSLITCVGGSNEQRGVLHEYYIELMILAKDYKQAEIQARIDSLERNTSYLTQFTTNCNIKLKEFKKEHHTEDPDA